MTKTLSIVGLLAATLLLAACSSGPSKTYTISGELIVIEPEVTEDTSAEATEPVALVPTESAEIAEAEPVDPIDLSSVAVNVTYETTNDDGTTSTVELIQGSFADGNVTLTGEIDEPTDVTLSIDVGEEEPMTLSMVVAPGSDISFALIDHLEPRGDQLTLYGESRRVKDASKKFAISGDLSSLGEEKDLSTATVSVSGPSWDDDGEQSYLNHGSVLIRDGKFLIESEVDEPLVLSVTVNAGAEYYGNGRVVVEADSEIELSVRGTARDLIAVAGTGRHSELVESWQQSDEYLAKVDAYTAAYEEYVAEQEAMRAAAAAGEGAEPTAENEESSDEESTDAIAEADDAEQEPILALKDGIPPIEECAHVALDEVKPGIMDGSSDYEYPEYFNISQEMGEIRTKALNELAANTDDSFTRLLALELGAFRGADTQSEVLRHYDELAASDLDADVIERRVTPSRDMIVLRMERDENDKSLVPGQKAPAFTLANLEGEEVALYDVLQEKEIVLVDFWASWCGPCIASFPHLKKLYSAYNDDGFEIVAVSIDDTHEAWAEGSEKHELPWIDVADLGGFGTDTPVAFGVGFIPKGYLLDQEGCIVQKDLMHPELKEVLVARYGEAPELEEEPEEIDESADPGADDVGG